MTIKADRDGISCTESEAIMFTLITHALSAMLLISLIAFAGVIVAVTIKRRMNKKS